MRQSFLKLALPFFLTAVLLASGLSGCITAGQIDYPEYSASENTSLGCIELEYNGVIYRPFGVFNTRSFRGKQIGVRKGDPESRICEVKGYNPDEWITEYLDVFMGGGDMLFKAADANEIPAELEQYKIYDY